MSGYKMKMGTNFKKSIFDEHIQVGLVGWAQKAKKKNLLKTAANAGQESTSNKGQSTSSKGPMGIQLAKAVKNQLNPGENQPTNGSQPSNNAEASNNV